MNIINNGNVKCIYQYTTFTCPVCGCSFEYANIFADDFMSECDVRFDHIEAKCPCCNTPVRNYFKDIKEADENFRKWICDNLTNS